MVLFESNAIIASLAVIHPFPSQSLLKREIVRFRSLGAKKLERNLSVRNSSLTYGDNDEEFLVQDIFPLEVVKEKVATRNGAVTTRNGVASLNGSTTPGRNDEALSLSNSTLQQSASAPSPLIRALKSAADQNAASFHFPGHNQGHAAPSSMTRLIGLSPYIYDFTPLPELDNLASPKGVILEAQEAAAKLFGSSQTWFLVGGTTCGIEAAIMATCSPGDTLILSRSSHLSAFSGMVLSGATPKYIIPEYNAEWDIAGGLAPAQIQQAIDELAKEGRRPAAVFVTSPTYQGICSNLTEIAQLCHSHNIPLIVDEAHGAHLGFHPSFPLSALQQGADIVIQSTHKVLCSLSQSSMLHMAGNMVDRERITACLRTLQSTSPSYLLLASLDAARAQLSENPITIFDKTLELSISAKRMIREIPGVSVLDSSCFQNCHGQEPFRLTIGLWRLGLSGFLADEILHKDHGIVSELVGTKSITYALNLGTQIEHICRLISRVMSLSFNNSGASKDGTSVDEIKIEPFTNIDVRMSPREAFFSKKRKVKIEESLGKVCGETIFPFPPGVPAIIPGETITEGLLDYIFKIKMMGSMIGGASDPTLSTVQVCED